MTRNLPFFLVVLFAAICFEVLKLDYYNRSMIVALLLTLGFVAFVLYEKLFRKRSIGNFHILLGIPVVVLLALVAMGGCGRTSSSGDMDCFCRCDRAVRRICIAKSIVRISRKRRNPPSRLIAHLWDTKLVISSTVRSATG